MLEDAVAGVQALGAADRHVTLPADRPWEVAVELERSPQMWSLRRKHEG